MPPGRADASSLPTEPEDFCMVKATEECLQNEAPSLGELMGQFKGRVSPALIGKQEWADILACARKLPVSLASVPFGFELPLHDPRPRADFGISVVAGGLSGPFFGEGRQTEEAETAVPRLGRMLDAMAHEESSLRRIAGPKLMLEYDLDADSGQASSEPGLFLYPVKDAFIGDGADRRLQDLGIVLDALDAAAGWNRDATERRQVERTYTALGPDECIGGIGIFPSRGKGIRLTLGGFRTASEAVALLERAGRTEQCDAAEALVAFLAEREAFVNIGIHFDMDASGIGPKLGLSFSQEREWMSEGRHWEALIDAMREQGLAVPDKLSALGQWSTGMEMLYGRSGGYLFIPFLHHVKYVLTGGRLQQAKAYVFWLMCVPSPPGGSRTAAN